LAAASTAFAAFDCRRRVSVLTGLPFVFAIGLCNTYTEINQQREKK
jgi:predicted solute-binding protein